MYRFIKYLWLLVLPLFAFSVHEYYISLTKVEFVPEQKAVQVTMKLFIDDLERALENRNEVTLKLATELEDKRADAFLERYLVQKFQVWINQREMHYAYLGKEYENDVVYLYLEIENVEEIRSIEVRNAILVEEFPSQLNYVKVQVGKELKTLILSKGNDKEMLKF